MARLDKIYLGTNTKMYKTIAQTKEFLMELSDLTAGISRGQLELFVIPSFTTLDAAHQCLPEGSVTLGAQNMGWMDQGPLTGEISPVMLREVGVQIVCVGHSERRHVLGETDEMENKKVLCAVKRGFTALLCIGETSTEKNQGLSDEVLCTQLKAGLNGLTEDQANQVWIGYEPVWAIGENGVPATADYVQEKHRVIKETLEELFGDAGREIPVLYGGSVNAENAGELIQEDAVDGLFIGRSAWDAKSFYGIIKQVMPLFFARKAQEKLRMTTRT